MPQNWKTYKLGDFGSLKNGANFSREDFGPGYPVINVKNLFRGRFATIDNLATIVPGTVKNLKDNRVHKNDLLFARSSLVASGTGQVAIVNELPHEDTLFSGFIIRYRVEKTDQLDPHYLNYYLRGPKARRYFESIGTGTTITNLTQPTLANVEVDVPPLPEQLAIASILSALDDKIELNLATNRTLERMAMALYKHWFVDFGPFQQGNFIDSELGPIPEGWEVKRLDDISSKIGSGSTPRGGSSVYVEEGASLIRSQNVHDFNLPWDGLVRINEEAQKKLKGVKVLADDVLLNITGDSIMRTTIVDSGVLPAFVNQHVAIIRPAHKNYRGIIHLYLLFKKEWLMNQTTGGTRKAITKSQIAAIPIAVPSSETLRAQFHQQIEPIYQQMNANWIENRTLTTLRDTLLPKLISGAVRVKDAERTVAHAL
jgi:type I restriction enzyme S subunit